MWFAVLPARRNSTRNPDDARPWSGSIPAKEPAMMNHGAWYGMGGGCGIWLFVLIGIAVIVLSVVVITKMSNKKD